VDSELGERLLGRLAGEQPFEQRSLEERLERWHRPLFVRHPLQSFSPRYFDGADPRLFSYAEDHLAGARSLLPERVAAPPLFDALLPEVEPTQARTISVGDLVRFFEGPIVWLLNRRLGVSLRERDVDVPDREPCELRGL
jgi:exodeoxyribonuclease V gamma subunit